MGATLVYVPASGNLINPCLVLFGGLGASGVLNDVYFYNIQSRCWTRQDIVGTQPLPRESHTANLWIDEKVPKIVIYGGYISHDGNSGGRAGDIALLNIGNSVLT